jgi:hypothetical protein
LRHGPVVTTGIGAKLLCSAEYVVGDDRDRAFEDMSQYSAILERLDVVYNDAQRSVLASYIQGLMKRRPPLSLVWAAPLILRVSMRGSH